MNYVSNERMVTKHLEIFPSRKSPINLVDGTLVEVLDLIEKEGKMAHILHDVNSNIGLIIEFSNEKNISENLLRPLFNIKDPSRNKKHQAYVANLFLVHTYTQQPHGYLTNPFHVQTTH